MNIKTARIIIRSFYQNDIDAFMKYHNDEVWMRFQGFKSLTRTRV